MIDLDSTSLFVCLFFSEMLAHTDWLKSRRIYVFEIFGLPFLSSLQNKMDSSVQKRKRKSLTIAKNVDICTLVEKKTDCSEISAKYGIAKSTISGIIASETKLRACYSTYNGNATTANQKHIKKSTFPELRDLLFALETPQITSYEDFMKTVNLFKVCNLISNCWEEVSILTLQRSWKNLWPEPTDDPSEEVLDLPDIGELLEALAPGEEFGVHIQKLASNGHQRRRA